MASQLANEFDCIEHFGGVNEQNIIVNIVREDNWTAERAIIASNGAPSFNKISILVPFAKNE